MVPSGHLKPKICEVLKCGTDYHRCGITVSLSGLCAQCVSSVTVPDKKIWTVPDKKIARPQTQQINATLCHGRHAARGMGACVIRDGAWIKMWMEDKLVYTPVNDGGSNAPIADETPVLV